MGSTGNVHSGCREQSVGLQIDLEHAEQSNKTDMVSYINGLDFDKNGALYVSWCHRGYVPVTRTQASQQAGPNGPENVRVFFCPFAKSVH